MTLSSEQLSFSAPAAEPGPDSSKKTTTRWVRPFAELRSDDLAQVGGKNASLGEMVRHLESVGVRVPEGFATTYRRFIEENSLGANIASLLSSWEAGARTLRQVGKDIRRLITRGQWPDDVADAIRSHYLSLRRDLEDPPTSVPSLPPDTRIR